MPDPHLVNTTAMFALGVSTHMAAAVEAATGLSEREVAALTTLSNWADGQSIEILRETLGMSQPGCARLVDRLTDAGLALRDRGVPDRRVVTVTVTSAGRAAVAAARTARAEAVRGWLAGLDGEEAAGLARVLDRLAAAQVPPARPAARAVVNSLCRLCDPGACGFPDRCAVTRALD